MATRGRKPLPRPDRPTFPPFRDYQRKAIDSMKAEALGGVPAGLNKIPTGGGKTLVAVAAKWEIEQETDKRVLQIIPTLDIGTGFYRAMGGVGKTDRAWLEAHGVYTAKVLLNRLADGAVNPEDYDIVFDDESHHFVDETHKAIDLYMGYKPRQGMTATPFRGTPKETNALLEYWGNNLHDWLSEEDAVKFGYVSAPTCEVLPLVDDETINVSNGEFSTVGVEAATEDKLEELVLWTKKFFDPVTGLWDRPTLMALTSVHLVNEALRWFDHYGLPAVGMTGENIAREGDFKDTIDRKKLLVQIKVVGEGVDYPFRRMIDAAPTMSPVFWRQRIGRIMRPVKPGEAPPHYVATNHNLLRHGYLLKGVLPPDVFTRAAQVWGEDFKPSKRMVSRAAGLDGIGKFMPNIIPLVGGAFWWMFVVATPDGRKHYCALVPPHGGTTYYGVREYEIDDSQGVRRKKMENDPKWRRIKRLPDLTGCLSVPAPPLTPPMVKWWKAQARFKGLDDEAEVNSRVFQVLPFLNDVGGKFRPNGELQ